MRFTILARPILFIALVAFVMPGRAQASAANGAAAKTATADASRTRHKHAPQIRSGIYGYSGAKMADNAPKGVIGECIWIYDGDNKNQISKGNCRKSDPGNFRVALAPGHYVVRGPGGNQKVDIEQGRWVKITSILKVPTMVY